MRIYFKDAKSKTKNFPRSDSSPKTFYLLPFNSFEFIYDYLSKRGRVIDLSRLYSTIIAKENFSQNFPLFNSNFLSLDIPLYSNKNKLIGSFIIPLSDLGRLLLPIDSIYKEYLCEFTSLLNVFLRKQHIIEKQIQKWGDTDE